MPNQLAIGKVAKNRLKKLKIKRLLTTIIPLFFVLTLFFSVFFFLNLKVNADVKRSPKGSNAMFINQNPNFKVEFGDKNNPTKPKIKFSALPSDYNPITGETVPVENNKIFDSVTNQLVGSFKSDLDSGFVEFSLSNAKIDTSNVTLNVSTTLPEIPSSNYNPANSAPDFLNISSTENLSSVISDSITSKLDELEKSNQALGAKVNELKSQVSSIIDSSKDIYASTDLVEEKDKKDYVVNKSILPGVDAKYSIIEGKGVKEEIIINKLDSYDAKCYENIPLDKVSNLEELCSVPKNQYVFDLKLDKDVKVNRSITTTKTNPVPVWYFTDYYGRYLAHIDPPFAYDANNNKTNNVSINISDGKIVLTVDLLWLLDPERAYPITIDPNITHDTQSEFALGSLNRVKDVGASSTNPQLETYYQELPADNFTVALWHFNEGAGTTANDRSGNNNHIGFAGSGGNPTWISGTSPLLGNSALSFDGINDYITVPDLNLHTGDFTIEAWINIGSTNGAFNIFWAGNYVSPAGGWGQYMTVDYSSGSRLYCALELGTSDYFGMSNTVINPGTWTHVSCVHKQDQLLLYINGVLDKSVTVPLLSNNVSTTYIGRYPSPFGFYMLGRIDEIRISKIARSADEIRTSASRRPSAVYTSESIDLTSSSATLSSLSWTQSGVQTFDSQPINGETVFDSTGLIAQWNFNDTSGPTALNVAGSCGSSCNGTLVNFSSTASQDPVIAGSTRSGWTNINAKWGRGALMFDGTNDYVSIGSTISQLESGNYTISTWVRNFSTSQGSILVQSENSSNNIMSLTILNNVPTLLYYVGGYSLISANKTIDSAWHNITVARSANTGFIYVDGILSNSGTVPNISGTTYLRLGVREGGVYYSNSIIDSTSIYSRVLSQSEILSNYQAGNIEFQTRSGPDTAPGFATWQEWRPITGIETVLESFDSNVTANNLYNWSIHNPISDYRWYKINNAIPTASDTTSSDGRIAVGTGSRGDVTAVIFPKVIKESDNLYRMIYAGLLGNYRIYSATSPDGYNWSKLNNTTEPPSNSTGTSGRIPLGLLGSGDSAGVYPGTLLKINNTYWTWYSGNTGTALTIMSATSNDGLTWTKINNSTEPASNTTGTQGRVPLGANGSSDDYYAMHPSVIYDGTKFWMWYSGYDSAVWSITAATSNDGLTWTKLNNSTEPASNTTGTQGRIPRGLTGAGDANHALEPVVIREGNLFKMWYQGIASDNFYRTFMALSYDGLTWTKIANTTEAPSNISFTNGRLGLGLVGTGDSQYTRMSSVINDGGNLTSWYFGSSNGSTWNIFSAKINYNVLTTNSNTVIKASDTASLRLDSGKQTAGAKVIGLWHLDETGGSGAFYKDSSSYNNNATPASGNSAPSTTLGLTGQSLSFNDNDYITCGTNNFSNSAPVTLSAWAYFSGDQPAGNYDYVIQASNYTQNNDMFSIAREAVTNRMYYPDNGNRNFGGTIPSQQWVHLAAVFNSTQPYVKMYINGIDYSVSQPPAAVAPQGVPRCTIGGFNPGTDLTHFMNGKIEETKITQAALTQSEIMSEYMLGANKFLTKTINATDFTYSNKIQFNIASDRPGSFLNFNVGESNYASADSDANTLALWHLDEIGPYPLNSTSVQPAGWIIDSSFNSNNGTLANGSSTPQPVNGILGGARYFDGNDYIFVGNTTPPNAITYSAWLSFATTLGNGDLSYPFGYGAGGSNWNYDLFYFYNNSGTIQMRYTVDNNGTNRRYYSLSMPGQFATNTWYHFAVTQSTPTTTPTFYINGIMYTPLLDLSAGSPVRAQANLAIGSAGTEPGALFRGIIDEARIDKVVRTSQEIKQAYDYGKQSHSITIDFAAKLDAVLAGTTNGSGILSTTAMSIDSTYYGAQNKGDNLYKDDKVIIKENYNGTEYLAQGLVTSVTSGGAVTVSNWDTGSSFPPKGTSTCGGSDTHCFGTNASVFKWQREYFDLSGITTGTGSGDILNQRDSVTNLTFRITNGNEGRTIFIDDLRYSSPYITSSPYSAFGTTNHTSNNRYVQYRAIFTTSDSNVSPSLSIVNLNYSAGPTLDQIMRHGKWFIGGAKQSFWWVN